MLKSLYIAATIASVAGFQFPKECEGQWVPYTNGRGDDALKCVHDGKTYRYSSPCEAVLEAPRPTDVLAVGNSDFTGLGVPRSLTAQNTIDFRNDAVLGYKDSGDQDVYKLEDRRVRMLNGQSQSGSPAYFHTSGQTYNAQTGDFVGSIGLGATKGHYVILSPKDPSNFELGGYFLGADSRLGFWGTRGPARVVVYGSNDDTNWELIDDSSFARYSTESEITPGRSFGTSKGYVTNGDATNPMIANTAFAQNLKDTYGVTSFVGLHVNNVGVAFVEFPARYNYKSYGFVFPKIVPTGGSGTNDALMFTSLDLMNANV